MWDQVQDRGVSHWLLYGTGSMCAAAQGYGGNREINLWWENPTLHRSPVYLSRRDIPHEERRDVVKVRSQYEDVQYPGCIKRSTDAATAPSPGLGGARGFGPWQEAVQISPGVRQVSKGQIGLVGGRSWQAQGPGGAVRRGGSVSGRRCGRG